MERRGFTLIELMVSLIIGLILVTVAVPVFTSLIRDNQVVATQHALLASLHGARSEAVNRGQPVVVCNGKPSAGCDSDNGWEQGWYTAALPRGATGCRDRNADQRCDGHAGRIISYHEAIPESVSLDGNGSLLISRVRFQPDGLSRGYAGTFSVCPTGDTNLQGSGIVINISGRMRSADPSELNC